MQNIESQLNVKDRQISSLQNENYQLKSQLQQIKQTTTTPKLNPPQVRSKPIESYNPQYSYGQSASYPNPQMVSQKDYDNGARVNKRKCPRCGAMGFAIKEFEDKNRIISYIPRRIYAMKKVCTKCFNEF